MERSSLIRRSSSPAVGSDKPPFKKRLSIPADIHRRIVYPNCFLNKGSAERRTQYSRGQRMLVIQMCGQISGSVAAKAALFGICEATLKGWIKDKSLCSVPTEATVEDLAFSTRVRNTAGNFPGIEAELVEYLKVHVDKFIARLTITQQIEIRCFERVPSLGISKAIIMSKALEIADFPQFKKESLTFKASNGWFQGFCSRNQKAVVFLEFLLKSIRTRLQERLKKWWKKLN